ncbi:Phosphoglycerate mutase [Forsythia ovata]|uniref:phosphoglycerate mutase (2,3-diphosphoglycerate-independent) n=1 Tax=Forsythia ovata TaxID=205694 RepID=A0ABD1WJ11_9LAMI
MVHLEKHLESLHYLLPHSAQVSISDLIHDFLFIFYPWSPSRTLAAKVPDELTSVLHPSFVRVPDSSVKQGFQHRSLVKEGSRSTIWEKEQPPTTPLLRWKLDEDKDNDASTKEKKSSAEVRQKSGRRISVNISARKLSTGLWPLQLPEFQTNGGQRLGFQSAPEKWRLVKAHSTAVGLPTEDYMATLRLVTTLLVLDGFSHKLVDLALASGKIYEGEGFAHIKDSFVTGTLHLIGLLSDGGVHSRLDQLQNDWDVVKRGWDAQVLGEAPHEFKSVVEAIKKLRETPKANDQYLPAFVIVDDSEKAVGPIVDGDAVG